MRHLQEDPDRRPPQDTGQPTATEAGILIPPEALWEQAVEELLRDDLAVIDAFIPEATVASLREALLQSWDQGEFRRAGIGHQSGFQRNANVRSDHIQWVTREELPADGHLFFDRLDDLTTYLNQTCFLGIRRRELHFAVYPPGAFYQRHLDVFQDSSARKLSAICYLNEAWQSDDGGQLRIYPSGREILPVGGRLVLFRSELLEHEVLPARRERYSLTGWLRNDDPVLPAK